VAKPKILLVDDTRLVLELEKSFLKVSNVEVLTAANGLEALDLIRQDPPDLVFMDMNMPELDGLTCCAALKADPFLSEIPVVMLTTAGREGDRERALQAGCNDYLTKPIDRREFLEMARKYTEAVDRRELRLRCLFPVLFLHGASPLSGHAVDISAGGIFLASHEPARRDAPLKLVFYLPAATPVLVQVPGRVAWVNEEPKRLNSSLPAGFGVEFLDLDEGMKGALEGFVQGEAAKAPQS
jgi:two-component system, cell cycle response regulator